MHPLTDRDKRTVRLAGIGIAIYLALFGGLQVWKYFEKKRTEYQQLLLEAKNLRRQILPYQDKVLVVKKLMDDFHLDPAKLKKETVVSDASAAIQKAAKTAGFGLGPIRESPGHDSGKVLATVQLEGSGPVPAALTFLASLNSIGFPLVVDSVQLISNNTNPGRVKMTLTILILDFNQQKEVPHA